MFKWIIGGHDKKVWFSNVSQNNTSVERCELLHPNIPQAKTEGGPEL